MINDPILLAKKLEELVELASKAVTPFEKAAVYAAATCIQKEFLANEEQFNGFISEKLITTCWFINAMIGYDTTNDHDKFQLQVLATGDCEQFIHSLEKMEKK